jgi:acyl-CoA reductase-like NAD-dependent aldehyde dehydrogenase
MRDYQRTSVHRTLKAYAAGQFVRSESGRTYRVETAKGPLEIPDMSRKDVRDALRSGEVAAARWAESSAYLRGQIIHRLGEMLETAPHLDDFAEELGLSGHAQHHRAADIALHYAGYTDKISQILGSVNAVPGYASATEPLGLGLCGVYLPDDVNLSHIVEAGCASLAAGNAVLMVVDGRAGALACALAERIAVSDVPSGLWQILPSTRLEAVVTLAGASAVRALDVASHPQRSSLENAGSHSLTRCRPGVTGSLATHSLDNIRWQIDYRTTVVPRGK